MFNGNMMTTDGTFLANSRDVWDFLYRKGIEDSDVYAIQEVLKDCDEFVSLDIYKELEHERDDNIEYYEEQIEHLNRQINNTMHEIEAIRDHILSAKRLNRTTIDRDLKEVYDNLWKNS